MELKHGDIIVVKKEALLTENFPNHYYKKGQKFKIYIGNSFTTSQIGIISLDKSYSKNPNDITVFVKSKLEIEENFCKELNLST